MADVNYYLNDTGLALVWSQIDKYHPRYDEVVQGIQLNGSTVKLDDDQIANIPVFTGATSSSKGSVGLVPAPAMGYQAKFLRADGEWVDVDDTSVTVKQILTSGTQIATITVNEVEYKLFAHGKATSTYAGVMKLYSESGDNTDGAMTQSAVKEAIADAIGSVTGVKFEIVDELPETGENGVIYLVPNGSTVETDIYEEYIWLESSSTFEKIGSTNIDMSGYWSMTELVALTVDEVDEICS